MRIRDVDFPEPLLDARKNGRLVIFAGAGVSIPPPSNYPDFGKLADQVGSGALVRQEPEPIDRFLGRLADKKVKVHERVHQILSDPDSAPNRLHSGLFRLFETEANIRLVTTNFDLHFTTAARSLFKELPEIHSAPALPLGDAFTGLVYLHGSVDKPAERLVLTDTDFGRAYITEGWARRFLQRLFSHYIVLFVGYSHNDIVMNYLARGLPPESGGQRRFALTPEGNDDHWKYFGISPVSYPLGQGENKHFALGVALSAWADIAQIGALDNEQKIKTIVEGPVPLPGEELDYIESIIKDAPTARFFTRYARTVDWLRWIEDKEPFAILFRDNIAPIEVNEELGQWFAENFLLKHSEEALALLKRKRQSLKPLLWELIARELFRAKQHTEVLGQWVTLLINPKRAGFGDFLQYLVHNSKYPDDKTTALLLFEYLTRPAVLLEDDLWSEDKSNVSIEVITEGGDPWLPGVWINLFKPKLEVFADKLIWIVTSHLQQAYLLLHASCKCD